MVLLRLVYLRLVYFRRVAYPYECRGRNGCQTGVGRQGGETSSSLAPFRSRAETMVPYRIGGCYSQNFQVWKVRQPPATVRLLTRSLIFKLT